MSRHYLLNFVWKESVTVDTNRYVLDSCALLAFLQQEKGWERVKGLLEHAIDGVVELHMSLMNLAEVQYLILRRQNDSAQRLAALEALPIHFASADMYMSQMVELKAKYPMSLADCFAAVLAHDLNCSLITADPEFHAVEDFIAIEWLE